MIYESAPAPVSGKVNFTTSHMKSDTFEVHYHSCYEIYYFLKGDADYMVEGREYHLTPHSLILLSPLRFSRSEGEFHDGLRPLFGPFFAGIGHCRAACPSAVLISG